MDLTSIFQAVLETKKDGSGFSLADLRPGERLIGRILKLETDGRVLMDLGRVRVSAQVGFPVKAGELLKLKVIHSDATLHLQAQVQPATQNKVNLPQLNFTQVLTPAHQQKLIQILDRAASINPSTLSGANGSSAIQRALVHVKTAFEAIPIQKAVPQLAQWLKGAVQDRGILFEKKLADVLSHSTVDESKAQAPDAAKVRSVIVQDLKANLLILKSNIEDTQMGKSALESLSAKDLDVLRQGIGKLLEHVVHQQDRAVRNWREGDSFQIVTHMLQAQEQQLPVRLKVYHPKKGATSSEDNHHRIALLLDMDQLGLVRADLAMIEKHLKIQFFVQHEDVRQSFVKQCSEINQTLKGLFEQVIIDVQVSQNKIAQFSQPEQRGVSMGRIDIQA